MIKIRIVIQVLMLVFFSSNIVLGQSASISGVVTDKNTNETVPYASIAILKNDAIVTGSITDDDGKFSVEKLDIGNYILEIQYIGYTTHEQAIEVASSTQKIVLPTIEIEEDGVELDAVVISAERSTITQKIDRKVINIGKDLATSGASARDVMNNIPSVSVNQDGEITLRGNENVRILVDGKPTNISSSDLLQQIPSTSIQSIELITNPSAKYNPDGMSGMINIILKKNSNMGFNGSINSGVTIGERTRFNGNLSLNYRLGKVNIYGSYGSRFGDQVTSGSVTRFIDKTNQLTKNLNSRTSHLVRLGMDYFIDEYNTLSFYTNQNRFLFDSEGAKTLTFMKLPNADFVQNDVIDSNNDNQRYNFDYKHDFKNSGQSLEFEFDYSTSNTDRNNLFDFTGNSPLANYDEDTEDQRSNTIVNLDYRYPINKNTTLEIGAETRLNKTDKSYKTLRSDLNNSDFSYDRNIYSMYTTFGQKISKWQYNIGVRLESYNVKSIFNEKESRKFDDELLNLFPSGFLRYTPDEDQKNSYQLSISRRIDRPSLNQINPIRQFSSPQIISIGNQFLRPQYTNSIELNYMRRLINGSITFGGFYRKIYDEINRIGYFDTADPNLFILDYDNFDSNDAYGLELSSNYSPLKWWSFNASLDLYTRSQKGLIEGQNVQVNNSLLNAKVNNSIKLTKDITMQLFAYYSGPQKVLQYELKSNYYLNAGVRYRFAKGKGSLSINFNDIFRTQRFAFETYRTIFQRGEFLRDTRTVYVGLQYRFGGKYKTVKRKKRDKNEKADKFL